jgi:hypothetical protein
VRTRVADSLQRREDLEKLRFMARAAAEVGGNGVGKVAGMLSHQFLETPQESYACGCARKRIGGGGGLPALEDTPEAVA